MRMFCCGSCSCRVPVVLGGGNKPGSFRLRGTFKRPAGNKRKATMMHVRPCCRLGSRSTPQLRTRSQSRDREPERQVVRRTVLLRHAETVEGEPARQSHHELVQPRELREQGGRGVSVGKQEQQRCGQCCAHCHLMINRRTKPHCKTSENLTLNLAPRKHTNLSRSVSATSRRI